MQAARRSRDEPVVAADRGREGQPALRESTGHLAPGDSVLHDVHGRAAWRRLVEGRRHRPGPRRRDAVPAGVRSRAVVGSGGAAHRRRHDGRRVARLLRALERPESMLHRHRHPRAGHRSRARSALGTHRRVLRRGPLPRQRAGEGFSVGPSRRQAVRRPPEHGRAVPDGGVDAQALPRLQQRDEPQQERFGRRRPQPERVLPGAVLRGDQGRQGRQRHDLVQQDQRRSGDDLAAGEEPAHVAVEVRRHGVAPTRTR